MIPKSFSIAEEVDENDATAKSGFITTLNEKNKGNIRIEEPINSPYRTKSPVQ